MISVTYSRDGSVSIALEGVAVSNLSHNNTIGEALETLGATPDQIVHVQTADQRDWKVPARSFYQGTTA